MSDLLKGDAAGALNAARDLTSQLKEQAKDGQIDGALLDQMEAILKVSVDDASSSAPVSTPSGTTSAPSTPSTLPSTPTSMPSVPSAATSSTDTPSASSPSSSSSSSPSSSSSSSSSSKDSSSMPSFSKADLAEEPASARAPGGNSPALIFDQVDDYQRRLPDFIKSMSSGHMGEAQKIAGNTTNGFDTMFNMAQHALLNEGGWNADNLTKINGMASNDPLQKAITAQSVPGIYLIKLAKLMLPVYAGLVNRMPADAPKGMGSYQSTWRAQLGFGTLAESSFFRVAEGSIGVNPPTSFLTFNAPYTDYSVNDNVTLKALRASAGYADPLQIGVIKAMASLLRGQERVVLGGNNSALAAITAPTVVAGSSTATSTIAAGSYVVNVSALTYEGWLAKSGTNSPTTTSGSITGEGIGVTASTIAVTTAGSPVIIATWPAVPGAVAYNVYLLGGNSGSSVTNGSAATYLKTVTINRAIISGSVGGSAVPQTVDSTVNTTYGYEGLLSWCQKATVYTNAIPNKQTITDNAGAGLTTANGGISQFDTILSSLWSNWHTAPSLIVMSPNMNATLVGKLQALGAGNFYRIDVSSDRNTVNGGLMVTGYVNKFAPFADGTPRMIDIIPHPYLPDGTILFVSETIPYPMGNETRGFVRDVLLPYTYFPLPAQVGGTSQTIYNFSITTSETVECFNPGPQTALVGVDYTL